MAKVTLIGAGSAVFAKNVCGDIILSPAMRDCHIALYDIDKKRLAESKSIIAALNKKINSGRAKIMLYCGVQNRRAALKDADYVINSIQIGNHILNTQIDFEIPKKYGLRQTIGDTLGIGGIFRGLRTIPIMLDFARDIEAVCPDAWFLNYSNPMAILTGAMLRATNVKTVGLCHSVQVCATMLLKQLGMFKTVKKLNWKVAGINHMAWLLEITDDSKDIYPEIKRRAARMNTLARKKGAKKHIDMVRYEVMKHFGYYITESSEHNAEYTPYWIKTTCPELIEEFNIPLDELPRRGIMLAERWNDLYKSLSKSHTRSHEYAARILSAVETDTPVRIHGNVLNKGFITNLPSESVVEIPCLVDRNGVQGCYVGQLPQQCAALNRTNINVQLLTIEAAVTGKKEYIYQAAMLDPHTAAELTLDRICDLCDDLIKAHGDALPNYK